jgi:(p)ppGpp synthase/HD superfamily hydrolase
MDLMTHVDWCIAQHDNTNHMYDKYLPYSFHLRMVDRAAQQFEHLLDDTKDMQTGKSREILGGSRIGFVSLRMACRKAAWGHDIIEDTRTSYNDAVNHLGKDAADIVYAVTNEKGKNRAERANDKYYAGIVATSGAVFVKLCDRIANVQYGKMTGSGMYDKYKKENDNFIIKLGYDDTNTHEYFEMFVYLVNLFKD